MQKYGFWSVKVWFLQCKNVLIVFRLTMPKITSHVFGYCY